MTECADEGAECTCQSDNTIYYGAEADGFLDQTQNYKSITSTGSVDCKEASFGEDPLPGVSKKCFCANFVTDWQSVMTEPFTISRACGSTTPSNSQTYNESTW